MPADGISLPPKKGGTSARPAGPARRLGYINHAIGRKGGMTACGTELSIWLSAHQSRSGKSDLEPVALTQKQGPTGPIICEVPILAPGSEREPSRCRAWVCELRETNPYSPTCAGA
jgi:hypothetical protein